MTDESIRIGLTQDLGPAAGRLRVEGIGAIACLELVTDKDPSHGHETPYARLGRVAAAILADPQVALGTPVLCLGWSSPAPRTRITDHLALDRTIASLPEALRTGVEAFDLRAGTPETWWYGIVAVPWSWVADVLVTMGTSDMFLVPGDPATGRPSADLVAAWAVAADREPLRVPGWSALRHGYLVARMWDGAGHDDAFQLFGPVDRIELINDRALGLGIAGTRAAG